MQINLDSERDRRQKSDRTQNKLKKIPSLPLPRLTTFDHYYSSLLYTRLLSSSSNQIDLNLSLVSFSQPSTLAPTSLPSPLLPLPQRNLRKDALHLLTRLSRVILRTTQHTSRLQLETLTSFTSSILDQYFRPRALRERVTIELQLDLVGTEESWTDKEPSRR